MGSRIGVAALLLAIGALIASIFAYGYEYARNLQVDTVIMGSRCDLVIAQLSDLHFPSNGPSPSAVLRAVESSRPQIVVLTGDYISSVSGIQELRKFACDLRHDLPHARIFACLGNWDYEDHAKSRVVHALESCGIRVLINRVVTTRVGDCRIVVAGLDDGIYGRPSMETVEKAMHINASIRILLVHEPELALEAIEHGFRGIIFAGHCHGGQIQILGHPLILPEMCPPTLFQGIHIINGSVIIVSRGIGTSHIPIRIGAAPQLIILDLVNGSVAH